MTAFQKEVTKRLVEAACSYGLDLTFEEHGVHAVAWFDYRGAERLLLVADGELILEWTGEHYFEVPEDPAHLQVLRFVEMFRLCLSGLAVADARRAATRYVVSLGTDP